MLIYVGGGSWLPDVPARDLTDEEVEHLDKTFLLRSGLYVEEKEAPAKQPAKKTEKKEN